ncbi:MAG: AMP-binding protein [Gemmatimonadetes bacterium]|nr:AMP-binding protein [Gemmatimonadota bacterium]
MPNPLSLFPYALAAGGGRVDGVPAAAFAAAGFTLLQRSAPLVRELMGRRSAILLPPSGTLLTALAASDGRSALLLSADADTASLGRQLADADVGAVFTTRALGARLPLGRYAAVLLDDAPRTATVIRLGVESTVDLGSHFGLDLEGEEDEGSDDDCLISVDSAAGEASPLVIFSHRALLSLARGAADGTSVQKRDRVLAMLPPSNLGALAFTFAALLLFGAEVTTLAPFAADEAVRRIESDGIAILTGDAAMFGAMADALETRGQALNAPALRVCVCVDVEVAPTLQARWLQLTGIDLRQACGITEAPLVLFNAPHFPNRPGTLGVPFPSIRLTVRNPDTGEAVARGEPGALWVRGAAVFTTYVGQPEAALKRSDGWLRTRMKVRERPDGAFERVR